MEMAILNQSWPVTTPYSLVATRLAILVDISHITIASINDNRSYNIKLFGATQSTANLKHYVHILATGVQLDSYSL